MNIKYIDTGTLYEGLKGAVVNNSTRISQKNGIPYIEFTPFDEFDWVTLHFSTRDGGVSKGIYSSMNFSFDRGDDYENVYKNYELFLDTMNIKPENCVCTKQTHTTNVIAVDYNMAGMGLTRARNFDNVDGFVTNEPGLCLITYFADCVPVYFIDPVNRCIGASHSGWRGTVADITHETVQLMNRTYGSKPEDIHTFIGPSICQDCYEVSEDVIEEFVKKYGLDFLTYPKEVLKEVPGTFSGSAFVSQTVGVDNVCERAALAACRKEDKEKIKQPRCGREGKEKSYMQQNCDSRENQKKMLVQGRLLLKKKAKDGMTLAIAEREWSVRFDET